MDPSKEQRKRVAIIGGGIVGLSTAWYLYKTHDVTVFEPSLHVKGPSEKNAGTITITLPPWTSKRPTDIIKDNLNFYRRYTQGIETVFSLFNFNLIKDRDFWEWTYNFMTNRSAEKIEAQSKAISMCYLWVGEHISSVVDEVTSGNPDLVDYHEDELYELVRQDSKAKLEGEKKLISNLQRYEPEIRVLDPSEYSKKFDLKGVGEISDTTMVVYFPLKVMNTLKFCDAMK